ncbi:MAG: hypothetical protein Q9167_004234 [Letrouitia subvulpina]
MLYEMIAVVRPGNIAEVKDIALTAGRLILSHGGVVRGLTNWGTFLLTKPTKKHQMRQDSGHHFILRFDASPDVQMKMRKAVAIDPRMIRCGVVKLGKKGTLGEICAVPGRVEWRKPAVAEMAMIRIGEDA